MSDFIELIDLVSERIGGRALYATDDFFAPKESLLKPGRGEFVPGKYTEQGKWMDGWESRRRRDTGHDFCILQLGFPGRIQGIDVDTNHFLGNAPASISLDACRVAGFQPTRELGEGKAAWTEIVPKAAVKPGSQNLFPVSSTEAWSHLRLHIYPDGGVARFRAYGLVAPDWDRILEEHRVVDLASIEHGGVALAASDQFFSDKQNLIVPGASHGMHDGWETRRKRAPGHDWVIVRLGRGGIVRRIEVDTSHFKGNFPDSCSVEGCHAPVDAKTESLGPWRELIGRTKLEAHLRHSFEVSDREPVTHIRLTIHPDGGVARLRIFGEPRLG